MHRNPDGAKDGHKAFKAVSEAYEVGVVAWLAEQKVELQLSSAFCLYLQVLRDPGKRATYDAIKDGFPSRRSTPYSGGSAQYSHTETSYTYYKPGGGTPEQDPFDEFFAKWWAKREHE